MGIELIKIPDICLCDSSSAIEYKCVCVVLCMYAYEEFPLRPHQTRLNHIELIIYKYIYI